MGTVGSNPTSSARAEEAHRTGGCGTKHRQGERLAGSTWPSTAAGKEYTVARARSTFGKLQRDQAKKDRAKAKMDDRISRKEDKAAATEQAGPTVSADDVDQTRLLEEFAALHEDLAEGRISLDDFEVRQEELRAKLVV
jgi:hypothetical protein